VATKYYGGMMEDNLSVLDQLYSKLGKTYSDESVIFLEGSEGDEMFIILDGYVEILKTYKKYEKNGNKKLVCGYESQRLAMLKPGDFFGEMAILNSRKRSATAVARGQIRLLVINKENFIKYVSRNTEMVFTMLRVLSSRIRETDCYRRIEGEEVSVPVLEILKEQEKGWCKTCSKKVPYLVKCPVCRTVLTSNPEFICWICGDEVSMEEK
jgi:CRP-like cAMP-binding protein